MTVDWHAELRGVLGEWAENTPRKVIISPDIDGISSACILNSLYEIEIIGIYTTVHLQMLDGFVQEDAKNALWLDHDVSRRGIRCVGQHLVQLTGADNLPLRDPKSWNPNIWVGQSWEDSFAGVGGKKRDKYPYGTTHLLWDLVHRSEDPSDLQKALLAHADGTWFAADCYKANALIWKNLMFSDSKWVDYILNYRNDVISHSVHQDLSKALAEIGYTSQSRSQKAKILPESLKELVGRQSLTIRLTSDGQRYINKIKAGIKLIGDIVGSTPKIGNSAGLLISGKRELEYPNRISNFDELMLSANIFSHAFTDFRSLSYTVDLDL